MNLYCQLLEQKIIFEENKINVLYLENKAFLVKFIDSLCKQFYKKELSLELFTLSDENKQLDITRETELIIDPFNLDFNQKKIINSIYENLSKIAQTDEYYLKTNKLTGELINYVNDLMADYNLDLNITDHINIIDLLKIAKVHINNEYDSLLEKLIDFAKIIQEVLNIKILILVNIKNFLTEKELSIFYQEMQRQKIFILLVEHKYDQEKTLMCEKNLIVDQDLCEIY